MIGTIVNSGAIIVGGTIGLLLKSRSPRKLTAIAFQGIGLFTISLGIMMAIKANNILFMIFSIILGGITGELLKIDQAMDRMGEKLKRIARSESSHFAEGMVTAFLLFCMGSMTVLGAIEEGLGGYPNLLYAKSVLDGIASIALASTLGVGVLFSIIPLIIFQGGLTLFAGSVQGYLTDNVIMEISATGGLLLLGLGISILEIKRIKTINMIPALLFAAAFALIFKG
ncbi:DUF554 domain-containing protein [Spirochaeta isovalerica]|uniref:DUF554 domain-containing protein n=1 Tax=Spirochaeta isovalerica TaxID=150 RepID=A0A841R3V9_9SPIO|nr:DUF554 domain-containing protein [Spirochaeta isovalerica]MBB6478506.1 hypothetical protein [Spirochaeta isovalerica]